MLELTINNVVYQFHFGMGFLREVNKKITIPVDGLKNATKNIGLQFLVAGIMDGDVEALIEILDTANKGQNPRVTRDLLDACIDDKNTDIDKLFAKVLDFLQSTNATKTTVAPLLKEIEKQKAKN